MENPVNHSYFYGEDDIYHWGNRAYFTYYGEFDRPSSWVSTLEATFLAVVFFVSLAANFCLAFVVLRYRELRTVTNYFILNLALADALFAASIPLVATTRVTETWVLGDVVCRLLLYFQFVCGAVLLWTLTMISLERYRCIVLHPMKSRLTAYNALSLVSVIWVAFFVFFIPVAMWFTVLEFPLGSPGNNVKVCTLVFPNLSWRISYAFIILTLVLTCLLPIIWLVFNYYSIFRKLIKNERRWQQISTRSRLSALIGNSDAENLAAFDQVRHRKHCRTMKILLLDVCITIIMWAPIIVMMALIHFDSSKNSGFIIHSCHFIWTLFTALANTCVNPLLYGFLNTQFRRCFTEMWKECSLRSLKFLFTNKSSSSQTISLPMEGTLEQSNNTASILYITNRTSSVESVAEQKTIDITSKESGLNKLRKDWNSFTSNIKDKISRAY